MRLAGDLIDEQDVRGEDIVGDTLLLLMNAYHEPMSFVLPVLNDDHRWELIFNTASHEYAATLHSAGDSLPLRERSMTVLRTTSSKVPQPLASPMQIQVLRKEIQRQGQALETSFP